MTAASPTPAEAGATAGAASTTPAGATASDPGAEGTATPAPGTSGAPASGDYDARIRANPDFASQEIKTHQSRGDRAEAQVQKDKEWIGSLDRFREKFSGSDLAGHLQDWDRVLSNPELSKVVRGYLENGSVTVPEATTAIPEAKDEFLTPDEEKIRDQGIQIKELETRIGRQESGSGAQALQQHVEGFFSTWPSSSEVVDRVKKSLTAQIRQWSLEPSGRKALENLMGPQGADTVELLALRLLSPAEREQAIDTRRLRKEQGLDALSTGGPSVVPGSGDEPPPVFEDGVKAIEWARAHPEAHDSF